MHNSRLNRGSLVRRAHKLHPIAYCLALVWAYLVLLREALLEAAAEQHARECLLSRYEAAV